jgi:hypothetical protein
LILAMFFGMIPLAIGVLVGQIGFTFAIYRLAALRLFVVAALLTEPVMYAAYRWITALGPVAVGMSTHELRLIYETGRIERWDLGRLRSVLLMTVKTRDGKEPDWGRADPKSTPVPWVHKPPATRLNLTNEAVEAVRRRLLSRGWTERALDEELSGDYATRKYEMRAPPA